MDSIIIYSDGSCAPNPGFGGWASLFLFSDGKKHVIYGNSEIKTTNNRMELTSAIEALKYLKTPHHITFRMDSQYVILGMRQWRFKWKKFHWKKKLTDEAYIKNVDLWQELDLLSYKHDIDWKWVQGHFNDKYNEICDTVANRIAVNTFKKLKKNNYNKNVRRK